MLLAHASRACHHDLGQYAHPKNAWLAPNRLGVRHVWGLAMTTTDDGLVRLQRTVKLTAVCHQAKRVVPKTRTFDGDPPTQWDVLHRYLDDLLDELGY